LTDLVLVRYNDDEENDEDGNILFNGNDYE
jgi:hypothetical protein